MAMAATISRTSSKIFTLKLLCRVWVASSSTALVLEEDGVLIGTMIYWIVFETCQLCRIAVSPQQRRKGYGRALLRRLMEDAAAGGCEFITLEVRTSNQADIAMYEALGFVRGGCRKNYYQDNGEDAYVYARAPGGIE